LEGSADFIVRTARLPVAEIAYVHSYFVPRVFHPIAKDQFPTNPLIMMIERKHREIFKVRNPIRNFHDKSVDILYRLLSIDIEIKDSEMNQAGE
jgi:hypothetical protein